MSEPTDIELLHDRSEVEAAVARLGQRIDDELGDEDPLVLSLVGGSLVFLADLIRAIERPIRYELIRIRHSQDGGDGALGIRFPIPVDVHGESLLVLKDVTDTGVTEPYLISQLRDHGARAVRVASLLDLPMERKTDFEADYSVFVSRRAGTFVGYGLKLAGRYGNLPYLGRVR